MLLDWDNDGFWHLDTDTTDALNLIPDPVLLRGCNVYVQEYHPPSEYDDLLRAPRYEENDYGVMIDRVEQAAPYLRQIIFARERGFAGIAQIPVTPEVEHTASVYVKLLATGGTSDIFFQVTGEGDTDIHNDTYTLTVGAWVRVELAFTPAAGIENVWLGLWCNAGGAVDFDFDCTGWMVNVGDTAPTFNAGHATNAYDDVTARIRDTLTFHDGVPYDDVFGTPAELMAGLDNADAFWNPNNSSSPVYGAYRRGLGVMVVALLDDVPYTLWRGTLAKITFTGEDGYSPSGVLFAEDGSDQMSRTEYAPPFQENVTVDAALKAPFDAGVLVYPTPGQYAFWGVSNYGEDATYYEDRVTSLETGYTTLPYAGDNLDRGAGINLQQYLRQILACECGGRFFWDAALGRYVFHNRLRDAVATLTEWTPGVPIDNPPLEWVWGDDVVNHVDLKYETRAIGTPGTVVWEYDNLPITMAAAGATSAERRLVARYTSTDTDLQIAVKDGIAPVAGTDYVCNYTDGAEESAEAVLNVFVTYSANTAEVRLQNTSTRPLTVTTLQLRATPVTTRRAQSVISRDAVSIVENGLRKLTIDVPSINTEDFAQQYADVRAHEKSAPIKLIRQITFAADASSNAEAMVVRARVGDALNVDTGDGAQKYIVLARQHVLDLSATPEFHVATYTVKAIVRTVVGLWETPLRGIYEECVYGL